MFSMGKLQKRIMGPVSIAVFAIILMIVFLFSVAESSRIEGEMEAKAMQRVDSVVKILGVTDTLVSQHVQGGIRLLMEKGKAMGMPVLGESVRIKGLPVPDLMLGRTSVVNNYDLVDSTARAVGGTETLFVKAGNDYVRVSTNVMTQNNRAVGTKLDPDGAPYRAIQQGRSFYGMTEILGEPYLTGYEPMLDSTGSVVGVWFVGYKADMQAIKNIINQSSLLGGGFVAILDNNDQPRFFPTRVTSEQVADMVKKGRTGWKVKKVPAEHWGFSIVAAYPESEVKSATRGRMFSILISGVIGSAVIVFLVMFLINKLVLKPLGGEPDDAMTYMRRIAEGELNNEVPVKTGDDSSMMASLRLMQQKLRNMSMSIHDNINEMEKQAKAFDDAAKSFMQSKTDEAHNDLQGRISRMRRTIDILGKSVDRFKV